MENKLVAAAAPHAHSTGSVSKIMRDVLIALIPAFAVSVVIYGIPAITLTVTAAASCVLFEYLFQRFLIKGSVTVMNLSAVVTGVLLAFNLPASLPLWMVILGSFVAIVIGKMSFGGLGRNPFNPALVGRVFLLISFPVQMTSFPSYNPGVDALSGATPLAFVKEALKTGQPLSDIMANFSYSDMMLGLRGGSLGEIAALALLAGGVYLLYRKVITWQIPVAVIGSMALLSAILWWANPERFVDPMFHLLAGGTLLGAIYMATDYSSSPMTAKGMLLYGAGIGVLTILIRVFGAYPEGLSFAILVMNGVSPLIDKAMKPRRFGKVIPVAKK